ncbi:DUF433 domain-containing protein [Streptomonospora arabica]|uniref:DUF433 domain-containing protein n=1 Tax=Streptomonospora arabica TaxID=412417 RepID=A0ABV9SSN1_9ACTN
MSDRLRQGRKVLRTLYIQRGDAPSDSDTFIGSVDSADLAAEIVAAVNSRREAAEGDLADRVRRAPDTDWLTEEQTHAVMQAVAPHLADTAELQRLRNLERDLSAAVWVHPGIRGGTPCVGGTRAAVDQVVSLMVDVDAEEISEEYPSVTAEGARAAQAFADRFVDRRARPATETDPRTEVDAHWGGDPERIVAAWENDRAELKAELDRLDTALAEARTEHRDALDSLQRTQAVAEHWRAAAVTWPEPMNTAAHPLNLVLDAARGETDPQMLGMSADDLADGVLAVRRAAREEGQ